MTRTDAYDFSLPPELVAAAPAEQRDASRLLVLGRRSGIVRHSVFSDLPKLLRAGDVLVVNNARVLPCRLHATRLTGGAVELLLVRQVENGPKGDPRWLAMLRAGGTLKPREMLRITDVAASVTLVGRREGGYWVVSLRSQRMQDIIFQHGSMPLPPYIVRARAERGMAPEDAASDKERYQTVYATRDGAVAAPTAGLHFTEDLLTRLRAMGVLVRELTLLVGPGTFRPVRSEDLEDHALDAEFFHLPGRTAAAVGDALRCGRRVIAVGTTTCRVLEYVARNGRWTEQEGWTDLFVHPPWEFEAISGLVTNFHLPKSTLLMLVSALAGRESVLAAYREAVAERYRFYSFGDAMFIV